MRFIFSLSLVATVFLLPHLSNAQTRHALVIGIDDYDYVDPLQKARNDARAVHGALEAAGFEADLMLDSDGMALLQGLERFASRIQPGDEAVFFFAGHGVEIDGDNILLPADIPAPERGGNLLVRRFGIPVADVLNQIQRRGARLSLLILDACRDNPFPPEGTRSLGGTRGLARMEAPEGAYIMYSAGAGQAALDRLSNDDLDPNSVFTRALLPRLTIPGLRLRDMVLDVRSEVRQLAMSVGHNQFPAVYDQLDGEFQFIEGEAPERNRVSPPTPLRAEITYEIIAGGAPCPSDGCFRGRDGMDLVATVDDVRYRVARFSEDYDDPSTEWAAYMGVIDVRDLNNDGYAEVVFWTHHGGNSAADSYFVAAYRSDGLFSIIPIDGNPEEFVRDGNEWRIKTRIFSGGYELRDTYKELMLQGGKLLEVSSAERVRLFASHTFSSAEVPDGQHEMRWDYDFTGDVSKETLSCDYWGRWAVLVRCEVETAASRERWSLPLVEAQCKEIGVLDQRVNGFNQLVCDFDQVYQAEPEFNAYLPVSAERFWVQPDLELNVRAGPNAERELIVTLEAATPVVVLEQSDDWARIVAAGVAETTQNGWVNSRFLVEQ